MRPVDGRGGRLFDGLSVVGPRAVAHGGGRLGQPSSSRLGGGRLRRRRRCGRRRRRCCRRCGRRRRWRRRYYHWDFHAKGHPVPALPELDHQPVVGLGGREAVVTQTWDDAHADPGEAISRPGVIARAESRGQVAGI